MHISLISHMNVMDQFETWPASKLSNSFRAAWPFWNPQANVDSFMHLTSCISEYWCFQHFTFFAYYRIWPFKRPGVYFSKSYLPPALNRDRRLFEQRRLFLYTGCTRANAKITCEDQATQTRRSCEKTALWEAITFINYWRRIVYIWSLKSRTNTMNMLWW